MGQKPYKEEHPDLKVLRAALERLRLGKLTKLEQEEWDRWEAFNQLRGAGICH